MLFDNKNVDDLLYIHKWLLLCDDWDVNATLDLSMAQFLLLVDVFLFTKLGIMHLLSVSRMTTWCVSC
jgi:hypothetical protein